MTVSVEIKVSRQSKATKGWILMIQRKPSLIIHKSKKVAVSEAVDLVKSLKIEVRPFITLRKPK